MNDFFPLYPPMLFFPMPFIAYKKIGPLPLVPAPPQDLVVHNSRA